MISKFKQLENLFKEIDEHLRTDVSIHVIGGAALLYKGLKPSTKDIDIITTNTIEHSELKKALISINFKSKQLTEEYKKLNLDFILERQDYRIDAFNRTVCKKLFLSENMIKRSENIIILDKLKVFVCSNEDILIFKSLTEREGDLEDCISLIQQGVNWKIILEEIKSQINSRRKGVWITWVGERLDELYQKGINIPIITEIDKLREEYFNALEEK